MRSIIFLISISLILISCSSGDDINFSSPLDDEIGKEVRCVVDGMKFTITKDTKVYEKNGKRYYFCGMDGEIEDFKKDPDKYITEYENKYKE